MRYALGWMLPAAVVVMLAVVLISDGERTVTLPPVQQTELASAATRAGCVLRRGPQAGGSIPVEGTGGVPADPGFYEDAPPRSALVGALRRGIIVIHYRPSLDEGEIEKLQILQKAVPKGTVVTPNERMSFVIAVTAYRRLLGCRRFNARTADAMRLFRGRYVGSGPD